MRIRHASGMSDSAWKSLVVKSIRMGWPAGLERAARALTPAVWRSVMTTQIFEDIFPAVDELEDVCREIVRMDFVALCERETHHGRGLTPGFCALADEACEKAQNEKNMVWGMARANKLLLLSLPPRALNVYYTWEKMRPTDSCVRRMIDESPWNGMPPAVLDCHCSEGRRLKVEKTILSGHYDRHLALSLLVKAHGWDWVRAIVHAETPIRVNEQMRLFDILGVE